MLTYDSHPRIVLNMENGVYVFAPESASWKTFLFGLLRNLQIAGDAIVTYNYWDQQVGVDLGRMIDEIHPKVVVIDRMDCFRTDESVHNAILRVWKSAIVLIDLEYLTPPPFKCKIADIDMSQDLIEVIG